MVSQSSPTSTLYSLKPISASSERKVNNLLVFCVDAWWILRFCKIQKGQEDQKEGGASWQCCACVNQQNKLRMSHVKTGQERRDSTELAFLLAEL